MRPDNSKPPYVKQRWVVHLLRKKVVTVDRREAMEKMGHNSQYSLYMHFAKCQALTTSESCLKMKNQ
jgi:hypothetical protein